MLVTLMPEIETARLYLRMFTLDDLNELAPIFADADVVRYLGTGKPVGRAETETALASMIRHWEQHGFGRLAVIHKEERKLIGFGGLRSLFGIPELVYLLAKPYWGVGLATEIARASLKYGFEERRFGHIVAVTKPENLASQRVMEKVGMHFEKYARYYDIDVVQYTLSREEFRPGDFSYILR